MDGFKDIRTKNGRKTLSTKFRYFFCQFTANN